jgi:hypothetical protein
LAALSFSPMSTWRLTCGRIAVPIQPVGIIEPADRAGADPRQEEGVDEHAHLVDACAQGRWDHDAHELPDSGGEAGATELQDDPGSFARRKEQGELQYSANGNGGRNRCRRDCAAVTKDEQRRQHCEIEQGRGEGGCCEARDAVENSREERDEADQQQVREGDPRQESPERELVAMPPRDCPDEGLHCQDENHREDDQRRQEDCQHLLRKALCVFFAAGLQPLAIERDKTSGKGAFSEQSAEGVREPERHIECVRIDPGAENARHQHLASEARDAADERQPADGPGGLE